MSEGASLRRPPRVQEADRKQALLRPIVFEYLIAEDHQVRGVWEFVDGLDLSPLYDAVKAVEGGPGRPPIDPRILMTLWLYATIDGVGSARALDRLCQHHAVYQWICGGVSVNYHTLADFRTQHGDLLDGLLTDSVATLESEGLVDLSSVSNDSVRVRASAGAASFRRKKSLRECREAAAARVRALRKEVHDDPAATSARQRAARERAAEDRKKRIQEALRQLPKVKEKLRDPKKQEARVSTTDPDARVMKFSDGGYRPAYNVQIAADPDTQLIVNMSVGNSGSDSGQLAPIIDQIKDRYGKLPTEVLADTGYAKHADIEKLSAAPYHCTVYSPPHRPRGNRKPTDPGYRDTPVLLAWRRRMATKAAKARYRWRAATSECVNALARNRGMTRFLVRGLERVRAAALWFALAHNMVRSFALRIAATGSKEARIVLRPVKA